MNFIWRFLYIIFVSRFDKKLTLLDTATIQFRVLPTDIDLLLHMNNGRYLSFLDLARTNFIIRTNDYAILKQHKIYAVVASEMIRFKKSLKLWQKFEVSTQVIGWDEKFFYVAHQFKVKNTLYAIALIKGSFMQNNTPKRTQEIFNLIDRNRISPPLPDWVQNWLLADKQFYEANTAKK